MLQRKTTNRRRLLLEISLIMKLTHHKICGVFYFDQALMSINFMDRQKLGVITINYGKQRGL